MAAKLRYSELLNDILENKIGQCLCPTKYMSSLQSQKPKGISRECQFGPNCEFSSCAHNKDVCTCRPRCTCEPSPQDSEASKEFCKKRVCTEPECICDGTCLCTSEESLTYKPYQPCDTSVCICAGTCMCISEETLCMPPIDDDKTTCTDAQTFPSKKQEMLLEKYNPSSPCDAYKCICGGNCLCKSEESLLNRSWKPPTHCDKTDKCICSICLCRKPQDPTVNLFPTSFRDTIKKEALLAEEKMKKECAEIKKCITDHKENTKIESEKIKPQTISETNKEKKLPQISKEDKDPKVVTPLNSPAPVGETPLSFGHILVGDVVSPMPKNRRKSRKRSCTTTEDCLKKNAKRRGRKSQKKEKTIEQKLQLPSCSEKSKSVYYSCGRSLIHSRPPHIRYYYSGDTEHYGMKLGHKHCRDLPQLVPKNMGWLWNIEDPGKGIRERKGWPPGFIGKNIKNMIKTLKKFSEEGGIKKEEVHTKKWQTVTESEKKSEHREEPPLIHIHKKGRVYNITFCPKNSDEDIGPIPIPFSITQKKYDSDTETSESTLEFELHSPKPRGRSNLPKPVERKVEDEAATTKKDSELGQTETLPPTSTTAKTTPTKKKLNKKKSDENKNWEDQPTQVQKMNAKEKQQDIANGKS